MALKGNCHIVTSYCDTVMKSYFKLDSFLSGDFSQWNQSRKSFIDCHINYSLLTLQSQEISCSLNYKFDNGPTLILRWDWRSWNSIRKNWLLKDEASRNLQCIQNSILQSFIYTSLNFCLLNFYRIDELLSF